MPLWDSEKNMQNTPGRLSFPLCEQEFSFLEDVIRENFSGHARELCTALLSNQIGGPGSNLSLSAGVPAQRRLILELLVHACAVFYSGNRLLNPLYNIASQPLKMTVRTTTFWIMHIVFKLIRMIIKIAMLLYSSSGSLPTHNAWWPYQWGPAVAQQGKTADVQWVWPVHEDKENNNTSIIIIMPPN